MGMHAGDANPPLKLTLSPLLGSQSHVRLLQIRALGLSATLPRANALKTRELAALAHAATAPLQETEAFVAPAELVGVVYVLVS